MANLDSNSQINQISSTVPARSSSIIQSSQETMMNIINDERSDQILEEKLRKLNGNCLICLHKQQLQVQHSRFHCHNQRNRCLKCYSSTHLSSNCNNRQQKFQRACGYCSLPYRIPYHTGSVKQPSDCKSTMKDNLIPFCWYVYRCVPEFSLHFGNELSTMTDADFIRWLSVCNNSIRILNTFINIFPWTFFIYSVFEYVVKSISMIYWWK